jgi:hypothetical protein
MRPLTVLLGIVTGSAVALAVALGMTGVVFLLLPEYSARLAAEQAPLLKGLAWSWSLALVSAACAAPIGGDTGDARLALLACLKGP